MLSFLFAVMTSSVQEEATLGFEVKRMWSRAIADQDGHGAWAMDMNDTKSTNISRLLITAA